MSRPGSTLGFALISCVFALAATGCGGGSNADPGGACASGACDAQPDTSSDAPPAGETWEGDAAVVDTRPVCDPCTAGGGCCGGCAVDLAHDSMNCGTCGVQCTGGFCAESTCRPVVVPSILANPRAVVVHDGQLDDQATAATIASALEGRGVVVRTLRQDLAVDVIEEPSGAPHPAAGETFVAVGGPYLGKAVRYLESTIAPVMFVVVDASTIAFADRATGTRFVTKSASWLDGHHDVFLLELVYDATRARATYVTYGMGGKGTIAAGWYLANVVLPAKDGYAKRWLVVEWTDGNGDGAPGAEDTFTLVESGA